MNDDEKTTEGSGSVIGDFFAKLLAIAMMLALTSLAILIVVACWRTIL